MKLVLLTTNAIVKLLQSFFELEINPGPQPIAASPAEQMLSEAETIESAPGLSVALLQLGLIGHLPEAPPAGLRDPEASH